MSKLILSLDFDGVIHSYSSGWKGATVIPDPVVPGTFEFLIKAIKVFNIAIFSSRSNQEGGIQAMKEYLFKEYYIWYDSQSNQNELPFSPTFINALSFPTEKPSAFIGIDDRVLTFTGVWPDIDTLLTFKPWNK